jgi:CRISPR-associated protein Cas2
MKTPMLVGRIPVAWWEDAFRLIPSVSEATGHRCGARQMLTIIAYDITNPKRLRQVAKICEDYGIRVEYSVFECRLGADEFAEFWGLLNQVIDPLTDRLVSYKICQRCAGEIRSGGRFLGTEKIICYYF